ncbi:hypothetical protein WJM97_19995 [Okeanomitos corallinicola TIOX110]|uniref:Uncharacterized protein n=1 Tax=Okeanomitos corallinicola TIOX110 TaxID=3133117 RepID=A0ABZ2UQP4_9CYAN
MDSNLQTELSTILSQYQNSFINKVYADENNESDILMNVFSLTAETKRKMVSIGEHNWEGVGRKL